jgi:hypothetical protein
MNQEKEGVHIKCTQIISNEDAVTLPRIWGRWWSKMKNELGTRIQDTKSQHHSSSLSQSLTKLLNLSGYQMPYQKMRFGQEAGIPPSTITPTINSNELYWGKSQTTPNKHSKLQFHDKNSGFSTKAITGIVKHDALFKKKKNRLKR